MFPSRANFGLRTAKSRVILLVARVGRLDRACKHIEGGGPDAIGDQELLRAREFLSTSGTSHLGFDRRSGLARVVGHNLVPNRDQGYALDPRGKEKKVKDLTFWPTGSRCRCSGCRWRPS